MTTAQENRLKDIITGIRDTRTANNAQWMRLLELAVLHAPEEALETMKGIHGGDASIQSQFGNLVTELEHVLITGKEN